jgi:hypothetical protein
LNDGKIPNCRGVRVHVRTGYNRVEENESAGVAKRPREEISHPKSSHSPILKLVLRCPTFDTSHAEYCTPRTTNPLTLDARGPLVSQRRRRRLRRRRRRLHRHRRRPRLSRRRCLRRRLRRLRCRPLPPRCAPASPPPPPPLRTPFSQRLETKVAAPGTLDVNSAVYALRPKERSDSPSQPCVSVTAGASPGRWRHDERRPSVTTALEGWTGSYGCTSTVVQRRGWCSSTLVGCRSWAASLRKMSNGVEQNRAGGNGPAPV